jgi:hypothetical protein
MGLIMSNTRIQILPNVVPGEVTLDFQVADPNLAAFQINFRVEEARAFVAAFKLAVDEAAADDDAPPLSERH